MRLCTLGCLESIVEVTFAAAPRERELMESIVKDFSPDKLAGLIEANGIDSCRSWGAWPGLEMHEDEHSLWTLSEVPFPLFNNVLRATLPPDEVTPSIEAALRRARDRGVPMAWWTGPTPESALPRLPPLDR